MKLIASLLLALLCTAAWAQTIVIKAKGYIDVRAGKLVTPANIVVEDGLIKSINPKALPAGAEEIDLSTKILTPGLMDMHVHLDMNFVKGYETLNLTESPAKASLRAARNAEQTLLAGFTTVRNVGQVHPSLPLIDVAVAEASDEGWIAAPRIIPCGHILGIPGGHADLGMGLGLAEGLMEYGPEYGMINGPADALEAVRFQIKHGAKAIKIAATAGVLSLEASVGAQQLSDEEMKTIVEEAGRHDVVVAAHAHGTSGIIHAINAGVRSIEHGSLLDDEGIRLMKEKDVFFVPTTGLFDFVMASVDHLHPKMAEKARYVIPLAQANLTKAIKAGVKIALGTDAPLVPHGKNAIELSAMMARGMTATQALQAGTINAAELQHLTDRGEIKAGLLADIIAVDENPLQNIKTMESVKFVMKGGVVYKSEP